MTKMKKEKKCSKCGVVKPFSEFTKNRSKKLGYNSECKTCHTESTVAYYRTKVGVVTKIYNTQIFHSKKRNHQLPTYTKKELMEWLFDQELFNKLYYDWKSSGYEKKLVPSVDRLDDYVSYNLSNIQLMTWGENKDKGHLDKVNGINNKDSIPVIRYSLDLVEMKEYYSGAQASRETGIDASSISKCCKGKQKVSGGFIWKYKNK